MNRVNRINRENNEADVLQKWLRESGMSDDKIIELLDHTLKQYKDIQLVKTCAIKADLTPTDFVYDDRIELDFNLFYKDDYLCYIYKTWKDPGFRIGRDLLLDKTIPDFKQKFLRIVKICTSNFISFEPVENEDKDQAKMILEIGIYGDGFNEKVLRNAVETLEESIKKIKAVLEE